MKNKIILGSLILTSSAVFLSGCTNNNTINQGEPINKTDNQTREKTLENTTNTETVNTNNNNINQSDTKTIETKLSISNKCIGCGKCARIDSEHFASSGHHEKATVISQNNLKSASLATAIAMCPTSAISLK